MGQNSIAPQSTFHGLMTDEVISEMQASGIIPLWEVIPVAEIIEVMTDLDHLTLYFLFLFFNELYAVFHFGFY